MTDYTISTSQETPLMFAAKTGDLDTLMKLIQSDLGLDEVDSNGRTAFLKACIGGEFQAAKFLLNAGAQINARDNNGQTAAHFTVLDRSSQRAIRFLKQLLIKNKADLNVCDVSGFTPLMLCAKSRYYKFLSKGRPDLIKILIDAKVDVNYKNSDGRNALMIAAADGNADVCELLLSAGAWPLTQTDADLSEIMKVAKDDFRAHFDTLIQNSKILQSIQTADIGQMLSQSTKRIITRRL